MEDLAGAQPVSLEASSTEASKFAEKLSSLVHRESEASRETDFSLIGSFKKAWFKWSDGTFSSKSSEVFVDRWERVYVPMAVLANGRRRTVKGVSFTGDPNQITNVESTEPRYTGHAQTELVCYLERA